TTPVGFGGRHVSLSYPRVRARGKGRGKEVTLPAVEDLREGDPMADRVTERYAHLSPDVRRDAVRLLDRGVPPVHVHTASMGAGAAGK
ncbi:MAG TPA: hypothetical protein VEK07_23830, partial [Polyangiaceae bacterium]|nr:hypothetical protein [Polyangiaceae bacterium]